LTRAKFLLRHVQIHPLLWIIIAISIATAHFRELSLLLGIIFIHEMGHAFAASFFSWRIKRIVLLPFGGVVELDEHGNRPLKEELIVVISGPLQHVWMVGVAFLFYSISWIPQDLFQLFFHYNMMILVFNLFPVWPLDGGKLLFLLFSLQKPFPKAHQLTLIISLICLSLFSLIILITAPTHLNVWIIIGFLYFSLYHEWKQRPYVFIRFLLERHYGRREGTYFLKPIKVNMEEPIIQVLERFQRGCKHPIVIEGNGNEKRMLDENEILHAYFTEKRITDKIKDLLYSY
jgi:stage IV sporulation protein FB